MTFFGFSEMVTSDRWRGQVCKIFMSNRVRLCQDLTHQKSSKSVNFSRSCSKRKRWTFWGTRCIYHGAGASCGAEERWSATVGAVKNCQTFEQTYWMTLDTITLHRRVWAGSLSHSNARPIVTQQNNSRWYHSGVLLTSPLDKPTLHSFGTAAQGFSIN